MFSPILPISTARRASTVDAVDLERRQRGHVGRVAASAISRASALPNCRKSSFLATKSVSQFSSTIAPVVPSMCTRDDALGR